MRMSSKGRFAVNAVIDLALREATGPITLASIGERQGTSLSYLEQLFSRLRRAGIVESTRGPGGGYTLGRAAATITLADIVSAVDEPPAAGQGEGDTGSSHTDALWQHLHEVMLGHMRTITLEGLVAAERARGVPIEPRAERRPVAPQPAASKPVRTTAPNSVFAFGRSFAS